MPRASIIIPTRDRASVLALALEPLLAQSVARSAYEIIVADDASNDETASLLESAQAREGVRFTRLARRSGAGAARNRAIAIARSELLIFLDDDAFVASDFVARHLRAHDGRPRALVAGGIIEVREPRAPATASASWRGYHRHPMPGGNSSVMRAHVLAVGGFDESFDAYGWQDQELAERLLRAGLRRRFVRGAAIHHYKPAAVVHDARHELQREESRGRMGARFYHKHPSMLVGITTKLWPPIRRLEGWLDDALGLERRAAAILGGDAHHGEFRGAHAALLRAHVEIREGVRELERLAHEAARGMRAIRPTTD